MTTRAPEDTITPRGDGHGTETFPVESCFPGKTRKGEDVPKVGALTTVIGPPTPENVRGWGTFHQGAHAKEFVCLYQYRHLGPE